MRVFNCRFWRLDASPGWRCRGWKQRYSRMRERCRAGVTLPGMLAMSRARRNFESTFVLSRRRWKRRCHRGWREWLRQARPAAMSFTFRVCELFVLTLALQIGMLPLFASEFHRITLAAPLANFAAVPLTAVIVPLGFLTLIAGYVFLPVGKALGVLLGMVTQFLHARGAVVRRFRAAELPDTGPAGVGQPQLFSCCWHCWPRLFACNFDLRD